MPDSVKQEAARSLALRLDGAAQATMDTSENPFALPITTLSAAHYTQEAMDRFRRWWDIEPENAMDLAAVSEAELAEARMAIATAFDYLSKCAPELHEEIRAILDTIVVARPNGGQRLDFSGVSSFALWGTVALNFDAHGQWPGYFRTIVHEAAHNLLFGFARDEPLVLNDPVERRLSPLRDTARPLDGIYHAGFVSAREALAFVRLLSWHEASTELDEHEIRAVEQMLEDSVLAFWHCVEILHEEAELSSLGEQVLRECEDWMSANFAIEVQDA